MSQFMVSPSTGIGLASKPVCSEDKVDALTNGRPRGRRESVEERALKQVRI
jgi:hypothetical protein